VLEVRVKSRKTDELSGLHIVPHQSSHLDPRNYEETKFGTVTSTKNALGTQPLSCATEELSRIQNGKQNARAADSALRGLIIGRSILVFVVVPGRAFRRCENTRNAEAKEEFNYQSNRFLL
jgi:hypothetical protein